MRSYFPSYGDRLAVMGFCRRQEREPAYRKSKLFERLKSKLNKRQKTNNSETESLNQTTRTKASQRTVRKVEIGWMNYDGQGFVQMRAKKGGGTRKLSVPKDWKRKELMEEAIRLFFPNGKNSLGSLSEFELDLTNYQEVSLDEKSTVVEMYDVSKLTMMRFYLTTKKRDREAETESEVEISDSDTTEDLHNKNQDQSLPTSSSKMTDFNQASDNDVIFVESAYSVSPLHSTEDLQDSDDLNVPFQSSSLISPDDLDTSNVVTVFSGNLTGLDEQILDDTLPLSPEPPVHYKKILVVHRGQIFSELLSHFCDETLEHAQSEVEVKLLLPNGQFEMGHDVGGVFRDCLSEFWQEFYDQCTLGNCFKVPFLRHDFGKEKWESVARIILFGWKKEKYLPIKLAPVFFEQAIQGSVKSDLIDNFLLYVAENERVVLEGCRTDFCGADQEELLEILDNYSCRRIPTEENFTQILQELAHKTLIQEPAYVLEQWTSILGPLSKDLGEIKDVYSALNPTVRKIVRSLKFPETMNTHQKDISKHLSAYLRECDAKRQSLFLRFCTGSDLFLGKTITVDFTDLKGFERRPVAHTCGCFLMLSVHYDNYPDFRSEMNKVLESNVWVMDII